MLFSKNRKNNNPSFIALRRVVGEFRPFKGKLCIVLVLGLVISAIQPISVKLSQRIIDELQKGSLIQGPFFRQVPGLLIAVFLVSGFAKYFHNTLRRYVSEKVIIRYRTLLFEKYLTVRTRQNASRGFSIQHSKRFKRDF